MAQHPGGQGPQRPTTRPADAAPAPPSGSVAPQARTRSSDLARLVERTAVRRDSDQPAEVAEHIMALGAVVEHMRDAVLITDADVDAPGPRIRYANPAFEALTGYTAEELHGLSPRVLQTIDTDRDELDRIRKALQRAEPVRAVLRNARPDGSAYWVELDLSPVLDERGAAIAFVAVQRDVTEREDELRRHEAVSDRLQLSVDTGQLGMWTLTLPEGSLLHNGWYPLLLGHDGNAVLTAHDREEAIHARDRPRVRAAWQHLLDEGATFSQTYRVVAPDGTVRWVLERARVAAFADQPHSAGAATGGEQRVIDGVVVDVTARQHAARQVMETLDNVNDGYLSFDRSWRFVHCNATAEAMFGTSRDELRGQVLWEVFPDLLGTDFERCYRQAARTGEPVVFRAYYEPWERWYEERVHPGREGVSVYFVDITDRVVLEEEQQRRQEAEREALAVSEQARAHLAQAVSHDDLTGLLSRRALERELDQLLGDPQATPVVVFLGLDEFKRINDTLGHHLGDELLQLAARRLEGQAPEDARVCRFAGDEFVVVLDHGRGPLPAPEAIEGLRRALVRPYAVGEREVRLTVSIGVAPAARGDDTTTVLRNADLAMVSAKRQGRDQVVWYDRTLHDEALERLDLEEDLRAADPDLEFALRYQPIYAVASGGRVGAEALFRWRHPERGLLSAGAFITVAEDSGLLPSLSQWALHRAAREVAAARHARQTIGTCWLNVAPEQLLRPGLVEELADAIAAHDLRPGDLGIELTERTLVRDTATVGRQLARIHALGVRIAIDDFGTGYASLSLLQDLPLDVLKIDRSFIAQLDTASGEAIVGAIVNLAHALGATASAEGVEAPEQWHQLARLGCDTAAGFLPGRPQSLATPLPEAFAPREGVRAVR